jgi:hypothetical protein
MQTKQNIDVESLVLLPSNLANKLLDDRLDRKKKDPRNMAVKVPHFKED